MRIAPVGFAVQWTGATHVKALPLAVAHST